MEFSIDIHTELNGKVVIEDYSREYGQYIGEESEVVISYDSYKYSQSATLNCITKISLDKTTFEQAIFNEHTEELDTCEFLAKSDGYYVIEHIILPTLEWLETASDEYKEYYETIYVTDLEKCYKVTENGLVECSVQEVMERNIEGTTLMKCKLDVFFTGHLQECYINYCKNVFDSLSKCAPVNRDYDTYARDFIWMTLNIIDYLIGFKQYLEAQRLLEMFQTCNGFCNDRKLHGFKSKSCGCS